MLKNVENFFRDCEAKSVSYSIWKSLENIEEQLDAVGDIDVVFAPEQRLEVMDLLAAHGFIFDADSPATVGKDVLVYRGFDQADGKFPALHVHFQCRFGSKTHKECRYAHEDEMFRNQTAHETIHKLSDGHFYAIRLLAIAVRETKKDPFARDIAAHYLSSLAASEKEILDRQVEKYFNISAETLMRDIQKNGEAEIHKHREAVFAALDADEDRQIYTDHVNVWRKQQRSSFMRKLAKALGRSRHKINRPGEIILTGPDGSGKSTVCKLLKTKMNKLGPAHVIYLGRREWYAPNKWINKYRSIPILSPILGRIWPISSTLELLGKVFFGYLLKKIGYTIIYDRCLYDSVIKFNSGYGLSGKIAKKLCLHFAKKHGDLKYFIFAKPEVALSRKPAGKYSEEYLVKAYNQFAETLPVSYTPLDTSDNSAEEIANQLMDDYFKAAAIWKPRI